MMTASTISSLDGGGEWKEGVKLAYKIGFKFPQRRSADVALKHPFFSESDENVVPMECEPITPPTTVDRHLASSYGRAPKDITPFDLLTTPQVPYQICPDWNIDHPISRHGRLSSCTTHVDKFLHDVDGADANPWLPQTRPIYSSHQKVHPVTDRPNSSQHHYHHQNRYSYGAHHSHRPSTPVVEHKKNIPTSSHTPSKRHSVRHEEEELPRRTSSHLLHHLHHPHHNDYHQQHRPSNGSSGGSNSASFGLDRVPHYGNQLIKWAPCRFTIPMDKKEEGLVDKESRPESRQCRTPGPFSSSLIHGKYASTTTVSSPTSFISNSAIRPWTPPSSQSTSREKTSYYEEHQQIWMHKSETHHATVHHRVDKYTNEGKKKDQENGDDENDCSNKRYICVL
ncbi:hypothetical protein A0J61_06785 [Choanephora cucurbitarum]|uniref:Uncharacterized protein n=1 Tax=Choanephora cucurbitarum TaxID=101091 RepID=A0A1C7NCS4_9FUNG|nr:hypothetical protein A0J61_06785 [Choanephora cucurbitarum]